MTHSSNGTAPTPSGSGATNGAKAANGATNTCATSAETPTNGSAETPASTNTETPTTGIAAPHATSANAMAAHLDTDFARGLTAATAQQRLEKYGTNELPAAEPETALQRFLRQFQDPMIYVLILAAIITAFLREWIDTAVIVFVVLINAVVGFIQEGKAADALAAIRTMLSPHTEVLRDGRWATLEAKELVPGDIVKLHAGDRVPADLRLAETNSLRIEESALTGESVPVDKDPAEVEDKADIGDRTSMAFSSTLVSAGSGRGVVTATGRETEIGHITKMLDDVESVETPLTRSMAKFSSIVAVACVILAVVMVVVSLLLYQPTVADLLMSAIGFAVAAIPEGLPAVMAITLALGVQTMARRKAITRRMNSVETLGSVTTVCSDKTGTLTRNEMTVKAVVTSGQRVDVTGSGYAPLGSLISPDANSPLNIGSSKPLQQMIAIADACNDASVELREGDGSQDTDWEMTGEPTDGGVKTFAVKARRQDEQDDKVVPGYTRVDAIPFDSAFKYMATLDRKTPDGAASDPAEQAEVVVHLKGAPDRLLDRCDTQLAADGSVEPLDRVYWEQLIEELGGQGMRVLAGALRVASEKEKNNGRIEQDDVDAGGATFVGLWGIIDPPREEVIAAVEKVQRAGVRVRMITGDHASTASAIAKDVGLRGTKAISGTELEDASDEELQEIVKATDVFARTSPEHKLRLVRALQTNGDVVAMTGDGVNDAPSLKQADVGVAMGIKGTEATKEAADVVLADDNFATIAAAMEQGRVIYDNLRKAIVFMLPTNGAQGLVIFVAMVAGMILPITPLQVLWVNLITAVTLSLSLSFEPAEPGIMNRPPRDPKTPLLNREAVVRVIYVSLLLGGTAIGVFLWEQSQGVDLEQARTIAVNTLVVGQIFFLFSSRFFRVSALRPALFQTNPISWLCVAAMLGLQLLFVYTPFMQAAFDTESVGLGSWLVPLLAGVVIFAVVEIDKAARRGVAAKESGGRVQ